MISHLTDRRRQIEGKYINGKNGYVPGSLEFITTLIQ